ncbi:MAG: hypothetical protein IIA90_02385, partial [Chloroflexi bacterium]|nr:hypothetical protein [Chloroflexota bacterium]
MKRLTISSFLVIALVALALLGARSLLSGGSETVHANPVGTVDLIAIDMDPVPVYTPLNPVEDGVLVLSPLPACSDTIDNGLDGTTDADDIDCNTFESPANGPLGVIDPCKGSVAVGTIFFLDVIVKGIDSGDKISGFQFKLIYSPAHLNVVGVNSTLLLAAIPGSGPFTPINDTMPDTDGSFSVANADLAVGPEEAGEGVLARIALKSVGLGISSLTLTDIIIVDGGATPTAIPNLTANVGGLEAQGEPCPVPQDVKNIALSVPAGSFVPPLSDINGDTIVNDVAVSQSYDYLLVDEYHNNGPGSADPLILSVDAIPDPGIQVSSHCLGG